MIQPMPQQTKPFTSSTPQRHSSPPPVPARATSPTHADVAQRAYDIYAQSGYQQGRCKQNWQQAEKDLHNKGPVACQAEHHKMEVFAPDADGAE
jgi:hypothetical protein